MNDTMDWEKDFRDFFFENGKYKGRKLGVNEYIKFIRALLIFKQAEIINEVDEWLSTDFEDQEYMDNVRHSLTKYLEKKYL